MKAVLWMVAGSLGSAVAIIGMAGRPVISEVLLGMVAPLAVAATSWALTERTYRRNPERLTAVMLSGFAARMVLFGAYVVVMVAVVGLRPVPFVWSFIGYFIALYVFEAILMRRLFQADGKVRQS